MLSCGFEGQVGLAFKWLARGYSFHQRISPVIVPLC